MPRPVIPLLIVFMAGVTCANLYPIPDLPVQVCLASTLILILLEYGRQGERSLLPFLLLSLFLTGILEMNLYLYPHPGNDHIRNFHGPQKIHVEGMICDNPHVSPEKTELLVSTSRVFVKDRYLPVSGLILLNVREPYLFHYGDYIRFQSSIRLPHNFSNPGGFDYEKYLRIRGILARAFVNDAKGFVVLRRETGNAFRTRIERFRNLIRKSILETSPGTDGKIIQAMILGDQKEIPNEVMEKFNRTGTTHIIAISGFNIGIVAVFSLFMIRLLLKSSEYLQLRYNVNRISTLFAILIVIFYTFIAGSGISVVRASIMVVLFMVAILINRERDLYNTLALAALVILIVTPYSLFDISFQLSFIAVASLLFLTPRLTALLPAPPMPEPSGMTHKDRLIRQGKKALHAGIIFFFASLSATLGTLPFILFYFNRLSVVALAANLVVVPILGVVAIPFCLFIIVAVPLSAPLADIVIRISAALVNISLSLVDALAALPWSSVYVSTPTLLEIGAFYLLLISTCFWLDRLNQKRGSITPGKLALLWKIIPVSLILFFIGDGTWFYLKGQHRDKLTLTAIDVGQGSAILIRFPGGKRILVDGGGFFDDTFDMGKYVIAPFLWKEKIGRIDTVVLSHPHPDHLQGLLFILENFHVNEVWTNGEESETPLYLTFRRIIQERGIPLRILSDRTPAMEISGVVIRILSPSEASAIPNTIHSSLSQEENDANPLSALPVNQASAKRGSRVSDDVNDRSLVMKITFGSRSFLLPGDISKNKELRIVESHSGLDSDVLFVPHHGGFHSSTVPFLAAVRPRVAIVSCGADNVFHVPHPDVLERFKQIRSHIYRTDRDGGVAIETDGNELRILTFRRGNP
jgi:competence protein ComEC